MSLLAASSSQLKISIGNSSATSVATTKRLNILSGLTPKLKGAFAPPRNQCNAALGAEPARKGTEFTLTINTLGRLITPDQFKQIIVKRGSNGQIVYLADVADVELGAANYSTTSSLDGKPSIALGMYQLPGSNALAASKAVRAKMKELSAFFPAGLEYRIVYDPTQFVQESVNAMYHTLFEAVILVLIVVLVFLQTWRATHYSFVGCSGVLDRDVRCDGRSRFLTK
jgi:multidrug efflux pump subunit AcrB